MPIVKENQSGLRRYAVISFMEDRYGGQPKSLARNYPRCPHQSIAEAAYKLQNTEFMHMKRMKSIEKGVMHPFVDVTFFASYQSLNDVAKLVEKDECGCMYDATIRLQKACYEELQLVDPKKDMIQTPIDFDDPLDNMIHGIGKKADCVKRKEEELEYEKTRHLRGFIVLAYKTYEDMYNREFVYSWKTWTGVRFICMALPRQLDLRRISFYRQLSANTSEFKYVLVIEISNLMLYAADTLNLMDRIRQRLCGYVGIYREAEFKLDPVTAQHLNLETDYKPPPGKPSISISRFSASRANGLNEIDEEEPGAESSRAKMQRVLGKHDSVGTPLSVAETPTIPDKKQLARQAAGSIESDNAPGDTQNNNMNSTPQRHSRGDSIASVVTDFGGGANPKHHLYKTKQPAEKPVAAARTSATSSKSNGASSSAHQKNPSSGSDDLENNSASSPATTTSPEITERQQQRRKQNTVQQSLGDSEQRKSAVGGRQKTSGAETPPPAVKSETPVRLAGKSSSKQKSTKPPSQRRSSQLSRPHSSVLSLDLESEERTYGHFWEQQLHDSRPRRKNGESHIMRRMSDDCLQLPPMQKAHQLLAAESNVSLYSEMTTPSVTPTPSDLMSEAPSEPTLAVRRAMESVYACVLPPDDFYQAEEYKPDYVEDQAIQQAVESVFDDISSTVAVAQPPSVNVKEAPEVQKQKSEEAERKTLQPKLRKLVQAILEKREALKRDMEEKATVAVEAPKVQMHTAQVEVHTAESQSEVQQAKVHKPKQAKIKQNTKTSKNKKSKPVPKVVVVADTPEEEDEESYEEQFQSAEEEEEIAAEPRQQKKKTEGKQTHTTRRKQTSSKHSPKPTERVRFKSPLPFVDRFQPSTVANRRQSRQERKAQQKQLQKPQGESPPRFHSYENHFFDDGSTASMPMLLHRKTKHTAISPSQHRHTTERIPRSSRNPMISPRRMQAVAPAALSKRYEVLETYAENSFNSPIFSREEYSKIQNTPGPELLPASEYLSDEFYDEDEEMEESEENIEGATDSEVGSPLQDDVLPQQYYFSNHRSASNRYVDPREIRLSKSNRNDTSIKPRQKQTVQNQSNCEPHRRHQTKSTKVRQNWNRSDTDYNSSPTVVVQPSDLFQAYEYRQKRRQEQEELEEELTEETTPDEYDSYCSTEESTNEITVQSAEQRSRQAKMRMKEEQRRNAEDYNYRYANKIVATSPKGKQRRSKEGGKAIDNKVTASPKHHTDRRVSRDNKDGRRISKQVTAEPSRNDERESSDNKESIINADESCREMEPDSDNYSETKTEQRQTPTKRSSVSQSTDENDARVKQKKRSSIEQEIIIPNIQHHRLRTERSETENNNHSRRTSTNIIRTTNKEQLQDPAPHSAPYYVEHQPVIVENNDDGHHRNHHQSHPPDERAKLHILSQNNKNYEEVKPPNKTHQMMQNNNSFDSDTNEPLTAMEDDARYWQDSNIYRSQKRPIEVSPSGLIATLPSSDDDMRGYAQARVPPPAPTTPRRHANSQKIADRIQVITTQPITATNEHVTEKQLTMLPISTSKQNEFDFKVEDPTERPMQRAKRDSVTTASDVTAVYSEPSPLLRGTCVTVEQPHNTPTEIQKPIQKPQVIMETISQAGPLLAFQQQYLSGRRHSAQQNDGGEPLMPGLHRQHYAHAKRGKAAAASVENIPHAVQSGKRAEAMIKPETVTESHYEVIPEVIQKAPVVTTAIQPQVIQQQPQKLVQTNVVHFASDDNHGTNNGQHAEVRLASTPQQIIIRGGGRAVQLRTTVEEPVQPVRELLYAVPNKPNKQRRPSDTTASGHQRRNNEHSRNRSGSLLENVHISNAKMATEETLSHRNVVEAVKMHRENIYDFPPTSGVKTQAPPTVIQVETEEQLYGSLPMIPGMERKPKMVQQQPPLASAARHQQHRQSVPAIVPLVGGVGDIVTQQVRMDQQISPPLMSIRERVKRAGGRRVLPVSPPPPLLRRVSGDNTIHNK